MSFLRTRRNPLNSYFFSKFQEQVSKAPGFKPILSYEDFQKLVDLQNKINDVEAKTTLPPLSNPSNNKVDLSDNVVQQLHKTWDSSE